MDQKGDPDRATGHHAGLSEHGQAEGDKQGAGQQPLGVFQQ
jgi:hypothetical protein